MALTNLTPLTQSEYEGLNLTPISPEPVETETGDPDTQATVTMGGVTDSGDLAFIVADPVGTTLKIDTTQTNNLIVGIPSGATTNPQNTYWTLDIGMNPNSGDWQIKFQVDKGKTDTGKWVFTKGKVIDEIRKY